MLYNPLNQCEKEKLFAGSFDKFLFAIPRKKIIWLGSAPYMLSYIHSWFGPTILHFPFKQHLWGDLLIQSLPLQLGVLLKVSNVWNDLFQNLGANWDNQTHQFSCQIIKIDNFCLCEESSVEFGEGVFFFYLFYNFDYLKL